MEDRESKLLSYLIRQIETNLILADEKTQENNKVYPTRAHFIKLQRYTKDFLENSTDQRIMILPGLRGVGKTTLLFQIYKWLLYGEKFKKERLIYLSLDYLKESVGATLGEIIEVYEKYILKEPIEKLQEPLFLFIDEAHYDDSWQIIAKNLYDRCKKIFIFVSGSSVLALNASPDLARRSVVDKILPLSFQEYLKLKYDFYPPKGTAEKIRIGLNSNIEEAEYILGDTYNQLRDKLVNANINIEQEMQQYLFTGGFPSALKYNNNADTFRWIDSVLKKIIEKDIPTYSEIGSKEASNVFSLLHFLANSIPPAPQSAANLSKIAGNLSSTTIYAILKALNNAYIIHQVPPKSNGGKMTKKSTIYYLANPTIRCSLLWSVGRFNEYSLELRGVLMEEAILATIMKNIEKQNIMNEVSYDYKPGGADFIVKMPEENIVLEVGWSIKDKTQIQNTMGRIKSHLGFLIHNTNIVVKIDSNILALPRELLLFA